VSAACDAFANATVVAADDTGRKLASPALFAVTLQVPAPALDSAKGAEALTVQPVGRAVGHGVGDGAGARPPLVVSVSGTK